MERKIEKIKTVRFASDDVSLASSVSDVESSADSTTGSGEMITWIPSEQLYEDDTFMSESQKEHTSDGTETRVATDPSYGTNTFIDSESEDETKTLSEYSYTDSFASSEVFSSYSQSDRSNFREWRDVTEIVRDIEELEESEFVGNTDSIQPSIVQREKADTTEFEAEDLVQISQQNFLNSAIQRVKLKNVHKLQEPQQQVYGSETRTRRGTDSPKISTFCQKMIDSCQKSKSITTDVTCHQKPQPTFLEAYGLSSNIVEKLKTEGFQFWLQKKIQIIDSETKKSLDYVHRNKGSLEMYQRQEFINNLKSQIARVNMDDCIQNHLIKMHPIKWFSELVRDLPRHDKDVQEILYRYKKQIESRLHEDG